MSKISWLISTENKDDVYWSRDCMARFSEFLEEHAMKIISFKRKKKWSY